MLSACAQCMQLFQPLRGRARLFTFVLCDIAQALMTAACIVALPQLVVIHSFSPACRAISFFFKLYDPLRTIPVNIQPFGSQTCAVCIFERCNHRQKDSCYRKLGCASDDVYSSACQIGSQIHSYLRIHTCSVCRLQLPVQRRRNVRRSVRLFRTLAFEV